MANRVARVFYEIDDLIAHIGNWWLLQRCTINDQNLLCVRKTINRRRPEVMELCAANNIASVDRPPFLTSARIIAPPSCADYVVPLQHPLRSLCNPVSCQEFACAFVNRNLAGLRHARHATPGQAQSM